MRTNGPGQNTEVGGMIVDSEMLAITSGLAMIKEPAALRLGGRVLRDKALVA